MRGQGGGQGDLNCLTPIEDGWGVGLSTTHPHKKPLQQMATISNSMKCGMAAKSQVMKKQEYFSRLL